MPHPDQTIRMIQTVQVILFMCARIFQLSYVEKFLHINRKCIAKTIGSYKNNNLNVGLF